MTTAARKVSEIFPVEERAYLEELRRTDPAMSLATRWERIVEARPDVADRRLAYVPLISEHGWAVIAIPEEGFAYTIGLKYNFDQPELLVVGPALAPEDLRDLLNAIGRYVSLGNKIGPGEPVDLEDFGVSLVFQPYSEEVFQRYATGYLASFERFFEDRDHTSGDTLPVLWTELAAVQRKAVTKEKATAKKAAKKSEAAPKKAAKKVAAKKSEAAPKKAAPKKAAPKKAAATKKVAAKKPAAKKVAAKKSAAKKGAAKKRAT
jgi:hypothetical protein